MPQLRSVHTPTSRVYLSLAHACPCSTCVRLGYAVLFMLWGLYTASSWAGDNRWARATLRGLPGVEVVIEQLWPELEHAGITKAQLQTDVELRLRLAGIRVLTGEERHMVGAQPWLYVNVNVILNQQLELFVTNIQVELRQAVSLVTSEEVVGGATTWDESKLGILGIRDVFSIRETVKDLIDTFINAYFSVNPRPAGSSPPAQAAPSPAPQPAQRTR